MNALCHLIPSLAVMFARLGAFYVWHVWQQIPQQRTVCRIMAVPAAAALLALSFRFNL